MAVSTSLDTRKAARRGAREILRILNPFAVISRHVDHRKRSHVDVVFWSAASVKYQDEVREPGLQLTVMRSPVSATLPLQTYSPLCLSHHALARMIQFRKFGIVEQIFEELEPTVVIGLKESNVARTEDELLLASRTGALLATAVGVGEIYAGTWIRDEDFSVAQKHVVAGSRNYSFKTEAVWNELEMVLSRESIQK